jgi:replicative superfamily II helicase
VKGAGKKRQAWIDYSDGTTVCVVDRDVETSPRKGIAQLAEKMSGAGPVLVVAKGKRECEQLARQMKDWMEEHGRLEVLSDQEKETAIIQRLDSRLEREMYAAVEMRGLFAYRIAYHHAGLPPRVRIAVEEAIRANLVRYVFATTTLAEGVNFPFSSVIVQSLAPEKGRP